jgi:predicted AlkP superfamily phosphohydrolase/phosphomutase
MTTIVIGLDGANWNLLEEWLEEDELPNLQRLIDSGVGGTSQSCLPPLTVPNWKCYSTGKNPGKLDVFRFDKIDTETREHVFHDATDFKSAEIWDYLNQEGYTAGVINKPSTYPPKSIDGFIVAGGPDASESEYRSLGTGFANPEEVETYLRDELDYHVHPTPMISPSEKGEEEVGAVLDLISMRFEAAERLLEREDPDFLHLTIFYSMALQHYFWKEDPVYQAWKRIDEELGKFLDEGHNIIIMSDHGTWYVDTVFYINVWLAENGYLSVESSIDETLRQFGFTRERALSIAKRLGIVELLSATVPERIQKIVPWEEGIKRDRVLSVIDWDETKAVASNQGPIYLAVDDEQEYEELRDELIEELESVVHPDTGDSLVRAVYRGEEHYSGKYAENAPDLLLDQADGVHTSDAIGPESWHSSSGVWKGGNMPEGIFLMSGPSFDDRGLTEEARIVDLAPTILHSMGVSVPDDLDGEVLEVFDSEQNTSSRSIKTQPPLDSDRVAEKKSTDEMEQRLEDLGYLE